MSVFRFPLQHVLDLRVEEEERRARAMADARRDATAARQALEDLEAIRDAGREGLNAAHGGGRPVGQLQNLEWVLERMESEILDARSRALEADAAARARLREFQVAVRDRQSLDQLRSRRRDAWTAEERKKEQKVMDELALTRHVRAADLTDNGGTKLP